MWRRYFNDGLALAGLIFSGLLPQLGQAKAVSGETGAEIVNLPGETSVRLTGQLGHGGLKPVREAFRAAALRGRPVCLDLSGAEAADRAFLGQVLMLEKHLARSGAAISLSGANQRIESLFRANRMNYAHAAVDASMPEQASTMREAAF